MSNEGDGEGGGAWISRAVGERVKSGGTVPWLADRLWEITQHIDLKLVAKSINPYFPINLHKQELVTYNEAA